MGTKLLLAMPKGTRTIIALSTPPGMGALSLFRVSGPEALMIADRLSLLPSGKKISEQKSHTIQMGWIVNEAGEHIDQVMFAVMRAPNTFTGEDTVEITTHNNPFIGDALIKAALEKGAHLAQRGEFTRQAVENGKINLLQAEGINELLCAQTELALKKSLAQLEGSLSHWIVKLEEEILLALTLSEASFEFLEEERSFSEQIKELLIKLLANIDWAKKNYDMRKQLREGLRIALIGTTNAGKSSLFNRLLKAERAIVTPIEGTTRDTIEATIPHQGVSWTLIDTAGIRFTEDSIEQEGIKRSLFEAQKADLILLVVDQTRPLEESIITSYKHLVHDYQKKIIVITSKIDLPQKIQLDLGLPTIPVDTIRGKGIERVEAAIKAKGATLLGQAEAPFLINQRHYVLLLELEKKITTCLDLLSMRTIHYELVSYHLRDSLEELTQLMGKSINEAVLDKVFSEFCIGK